MSQLNIFTDLTESPSKNATCALLKPFQPEQAQKNGSWNDIYAEYESLGDSIFNLTGLNEADFVVLPFDWANISGWVWWQGINEKLLQSALDFLELAKAAHKPTVIFYSGDGSYRNLEVKERFDDNILVFRHSILKSKQKEHEFSFPYFIEDFCQFYLDNQLVLRDKQDKPKIGFDGRAFKKNPYHQMKGFLLQGPDSYQHSFKPSYLGQFIRMQALEQLQQSALIESNFNIRKKMVFSKAKNPQSKLQIRLNYVQNIVESDYVLCCRGTTNFSRRHFESLCCGRIPVFIDTDCSLPYDFDVDWKKYCVWVDQQEVSNIAEIVADFHARLHPQEFKDLQYECRRFWKERLSPEGFFSHFHKHFH